MSGRRDSWVKNYQDVDFDVPLSAQSKEEREAMLQSAATTTTSSPSTTPEPLATPSDLPPARPRPPKKPTSHHTTGPAQHEASSSASPPQQHLESGGAVGEHGTLSNARSPRASSFKSFASSPLNPAPAMFPSPFARPGSRGSAYMNRLVSEESRAFANNSPHTLSTSTSRGSMILYRRADGAAQPNEEGLLPPSFSHLNRNSVYSTSGDSIVSLGSDSKYPAGTIGSERGLIAYAYDPLMDELEPVTEEDNLHDPDEKDPVSSAISSLSWRGFLNIFTLVALVTALLCLFVVYPVTMAFADNGREFLITRNTRINSTGQAVPMSFDPRRSQVVIGTPFSAIDRATPLKVLTLDSGDKARYDLVFSDEFESSGRTFYPGDDNLWEADSSSDVYSPSQLATHSGKLLIRLDTLRSPQRGQGRGRGRDQQEQEMLSLSGLLRNRVPFCMGAGGFVEVGLSVSGQRKRVGKSRAAEVQRVIYQPGYSNKWTSLDADTPIPSRSDQDAAQDIALTLAVGIPFGSSSSSRPTSERSTNVVGVQYIRVYRTRTSLTAEEAVGVWDCASGVVEENVVLDVLQYSLSTGS